MIRRHFSGFGKGDFVFSKTGVSHGGEIYRQHLQNRNRKTKGYCRENTVAIRRIKQ